MLTGITYLMLTSVIYIRFQGSLYVIVVGGWSDALEYVDKVKMLSLIYLNMKK